jgi:hypothetical protein
MDASVVTAARSGLTRAEVSTALGIEETAMNGSLWSIAPALTGIVLLRGCPTCWTLGFLETLSARSTRLVCRDGSCTVVHRDQPRSSAARSAAGSDVGTLHEPCTHT